MRLFVAIASVFLLAASCEPQKKVVDTPPPAPEAAPEPVVIEKSEPDLPRFQMSNILGLEKSSVENILGLPSLKRVEKEAEVWLYDNRFCNAHVYFYKNDNNDMRVEYIETSEEKDLVGIEGQRADFCISTFLQN